MLGWLSDGVGCLLGRCVFIGFFYVSGFRNVSDKSIAAVWGWADAAILAIFCALQAIS